MGAQQSQESQKFIQNFNSQYQLMRDLNHPRFGEIQIYKNKLNGGLIMTKSHWCQNEIEFKALIKKFETRSDQDKANLLKLLGYHSNQSNQLCGDFTKIQIYFEYFENTLEQQIYLRAQSQQFFSEVELWKLLLTIISSEIFLLKSGKILGDIRPPNILLDLNNNIKLAEYNLFTNDKNLRTNQTFENGYLSPEQISSSNGFQVIPTQKSDIFALGVTMIELSTLQNIKQIYNDPQNFQYPTLLQYLDQVNKLGYSVTWYRMLREMIKLNPDERPSFEEINTVLEPYHVQIMTLQPFSIDQQQTQLQFIPQNSYQLPKQTQSTYQLQGQVQIQQQLNSQQFQRQPINQQNQSPLQQQPNYLASINQQPQQLMQYPIPIQSQITSVQQPQIIQYGQIAPNQPLPQQRTLQMPIQEQQLTDQYVMTSPSQSYPIQTSPYKAEIPSSMYTQQYQQQQPTYDQNYLFQPQPQEYGKPESEQGLSELDQRIQRALKNSQDTANRHYQTPSYY